MNRNTTCSCARNSRDNGSFQLCIGVIFALLLFIQPAIAQEPTKPDLTGRTKLILTTPRPETQQKGTDWLDFLSSGRDLALAAPTSITDLSKGLKVRWQFRKGNGYAAPIVVGKTVVLFHRLERWEQIVALDRETGAVRWSHCYPCDYKDRYGFSNGPRASPVSDGKLVFCLGVKSQLSCLELASGKVLWSKNLAKAYSADSSFFGTTSCPLLHNGSLFINFGAKKSETVICLDASTGKEKWTYKDDWAASYASPVMAKVHGKLKLFVFAGGESRPPVGGLLLIDPESGKLHSRFAWRSKSYESVNASLPVVYGNSVLITASYKTGATLLDIDKNFHLKQKWVCREFGLHFATAILLKDHFYGFAGRHMRGANLVCVDARTGKLKWSKDISWKETFQGREIVAAPGRAGLMKINQTVLCWGETGELLTLNLTPEKCEIASKWRPFYAPESWTNPVISRGLIFVTQNSKGYGEDQPRLICYDFYKASSK